MTDLAELQSPILKARMCGGWLAVASKGSPLPFGVTGDTEMDARTKYEASLKRWLEIAEVEDSASGG